MTLRRWRVMNGSVGSSLQKNSKPEKSILSGWLRNCSKENVGLVAGLVARIEVKGRRAFNRLVNSLECVRLVLVVIQKSDLTDAI